MLRSVADPAGRSPDAERRPRTMPRPDCPKARMIDPRGHRFGAGLSARPAGRRVRRASAACSSPWRSPRSASAPPSGCAGRSTAIDLATHRAGALGCHRRRPSTSTRRGSPRRSGSVALILSLLAFAVGAAPRRLGPRLCRRRAADAPGRHRLLPRLPAVLPALVGAGPRDPDLDTRERPHLARAPRARSRSATAERSGSDAHSGRRGCRAGRRDPWRSPRPRLRRVRLPVEWIR